MLSTCDASYEDMRGTISTIRTNYLLSDDDDDDDDKQLTFFSRQFVARLSPPGALYEVAPNVFSMISQSWPLSQEAGKLSGVCSVCLATRQLHIRDGAVHKHGPRNKPCAGSNKPPVNCCNAVQVNSGVQSNTAPIVIASSVSS